MAEAEAWVMIPKAINKGTECILDMRPLVLCKNCKHRPEKVMEHGVRYTKCDGKCPFWANQQEIMEKDDFFCAEGERKDGEQE